MTPIQFVPVDVSELIQVFQTAEKIVVLNESGEDVTDKYDIEIRKKGQTEMVLVKYKKRKA